MNGVRSVSFRETSNGLEVHVHKTPGTKSGKLKKRLPYNFKQLSKQIMQAKTSDSARPLVAKMRAKLSWLYKQLRNGDYGESEVNAAIIHAAAMERIAKRKVRHLEEEEAAENGGGRGSSEEDEEIFGKDEYKESLEENQEISDEQMRRMMEEIEKLEQELAEDAMSEMQDMLACAPGDMSEEEIEELKRKHRTSEEKQLTRADLRYLKALFDGLEQEKRQLASGSAGSTFSGSSDTSSFSCSVDCVPDIETMDMDIGDFDMSI